MDLARQTCTRYQPLTVFKQLQWALTSIPMIQAVVNQSSD